MRKRHHYFRLAAGTAVAALGVFATAAGAGATIHQTYFTPSGSGAIGSAADCGTSHGGSIPTSLSGLLLNGQDNVGKNASNANRLDCAQAGYVATGRDFRFAQAVITVPNHVPTSADAWEYVALDTGVATSAIPDFARIGVAPCADDPRNPGNGWCVFTATIDPNLANPVFVFTPVPNAEEGDGVLVQAYYSGGDVQYTALLPTGDTPLYQANVTRIGPAFTRAEALADWGPAAVESQSPAPVPPAQDKVRDSQFLEGQFTTVSGARGTFRGPWALNGVQATSNGQLAPAGTVVGDPSYLWGAGGNSFGVWRYPF